MPNLYPCFHAGQRQNIDVELIDSTPEEKEQYLKFMWKEGLKAKGKYNIRKALSNEKSAVYAGISESFKSK